MIIAFLVAVSILLTMALQRASAVEPQIVEISNGYTTGSTCSVYSEYEYTADNAWVDNFKFTVTSANLGTVVSDTVVDANTRTVRLKKAVTLTDQPGLCKKTSPNGVWFYTKAAIAVLASYTVYYGLLGAILIMAARAGVGPNDRRVSLTAGCIAGAAQSAVSNEILGVNAWQQIVSGAMVGCIADALGQPVYAAFYEYARKLAQQNGWTPPRESTADPVAQGDIEAVEGYVGSL